MGLSPSLFRGVYGETFDFLCEEAGSQLADRHVPCAALLHPTYIHTQDSEVGHGFIALQGFSRSNVKKLSAGDLIYVT